MEILINIIKKIENILLSLDNILDQEHKNLLKNTTIKELKTIFKKKEHYFNLFLQLNKERISLEKKINIFSPYENHYKLKKYWTLIVKKCLYLKKINLQNKILLNKKFYLNQYFLELFSPHQKCITYNINGNLEI
ncbi:Flagella synthesis protein FlgN [Buchnera aphidicola (Brachycaudus tragopogonis)]